MADCPSLAGCGFLKKHGETKQLACKGFISSYCRGEKQNECKRKEHKARTGTPPSDDMMPNGAMMAVH